MATMLVCYARSAGVPRGVIDEGGTMRLLTVAGLALSATVVVCGCAQDDTVPSAAPPTPLVVYVTPEPVMAAESAEASSPAPASEPAVTQAPVPSPTADPTPDPEALRTTAAAQYLAAATKANKANKALNRKFPKTFKSLKQARRYWRASAKIEGTFIAKIRIIQVPPDTAADMRKLIARVAASQAIELEAAHAKSWLSLSRTDAAMDKIFRRHTAAANLVRSDLGLPPVYS